MQKLNYKHTKWKIIHQYRSLQWRVGEPVNVYIIIWFSGRPSLFAYVWYIIPCMEITWKGRWNNILVGNSPSVDSFLQCYLYKFSTSSSLFVQPHFSITDFPFPLSFLTSNFNHSFIYKGKLNFTFKFFP